MMCLQVNYNNVIRVHIQGSQIIITHEPWLCVCISVSL